MSSPTFALSACPRCSSREGGLCQPFWKYAHNTSASRGRNCYFWVSGCRDAEVAQGNQIFDDPADWERIEGAWRAKADAMFAELTARWTVGQRERWAALLANRTHIEGTTRPLDLSPASSGSTEAQTNKDHHG